MAKSGEDHNMHPSSWLFVRGPESIRIIRASSGALIVSGPGHSQARRTFQDEPAMQAHQVDLAERLSAAGWLLYGVRITTGVAESNVGQCLAPPRTDGEGLRWSGALLSHLSETRAL